MQHRRELRSPRPSTQQPSPRKANFRHQATHGRPWVLLLLLTAMVLAVVGVLKMHDVLPVALHTTERQRDDGSKEKQLLAMELPVTAEAVGPLGSSSDAQVAPAAAPGGRNPTTVSPSGSDTASAKHIKRVKHPDVDSQLSSTPTQVATASNTHDSWSWQQELTTQGCSHAALPPQLARQSPEALYARFNPANNPRYYDIGSWRHSKLPELRRLMYQQGGGVAGDMCFFVRSSLLGLTLGASRWLLAGARLPDNATDMAASGHEGRMQLLRLMSEAKNLGLNTIRALAFKDGHNLPYALQVVPGVLDEWTMRDGLDWIVWQARMYGLRVILVLTSGLSLERGGMSQYVRWYDPQGTITNFYRNDTYKARFFDYMTAVAVRENTYTRIQHRHDPTILGWEIAEHPTHPGPPRHADDLQGWLPYMANFIRRMDPNHLVFAGGHGLFGAASPHHLYLNPPLQPRLSWLLGTGMTSGHQAAILPPGISTAAVCEGADFMRNSMIREVDMSVVSVLPDEWLACDDQCKMQWARDWVAAHVRDALRMQKPLLVGHMHMRGPPARQQALERLVLDYLTHANKLGMPIAGAFVSLPSQSFCSADGAEQTAEWNTACAIPQHTSPDSATAEQVDAAGGPLHTATGAGAAAVLPQADGVPGSEATRHVATGTSGPGSKKQAASGSAVITPEAMGQVATASDTRTGSARTPDVRTGSASSASAKRASSIMVRPSTEGTPGGPLSTGSATTTPSSSGFLSSWWAWLSSLIPTPPDLLFATAPQGRIHIQQQPQSQSPSLATGIHIQQQPQSQTLATETAPAESIECSHWAVQAAASPEAVMTAYWRHFLRGDEWIQCLHQHAAAEFARSLLPSSKVQGASSKLDRTEVEQADIEADAALRISTGSRSARLTPQASGISTGQGIATSGLPTDQGTIRSAYGKAPASGDLNSNAPTDSWVMPTSEGGVGVHREAAGRGASAITEHIRATQQAIKDLLGSVPQM